MSREIANKHKVSEVHLRSAHTAHFSAANSSLDPHPPYRDGYTVPLSEFLHN